MSTLVTTETESDIERFVNLVFQPGELVELRMLRSAGAASGYFSDPDALASAAEYWSGKLPVYFTLNPPKREAIRGTENQVKTFVRRGETTGNHEIERRRLMLIDCDPIKRDADGNELENAPDFAATQQELEASIERAYSVREYLRSLGWPEPLFATSGNGGHLIYRIDLPADDGDLVKGVLYSLAERFTDSTVKIDKSVHNANRICRFYGTLNMKGDNSPERPHRLAEIIEAPERLDTVARELLESLAGPLAASEPQQPSKSLAGYGVDFNLAGFLDKHGLEYREKQDSERGTMYELRACPFAQHGKEFHCAVWLWDGQPCFHCFAGKCEGKSWADFKLAILSASAPAPATDRSAALPESHDDPHRLARVFLSRYQHPDARTYCYSSGSPYAWQDGYWQRQEQREIDLELAEVIKAEFDRWGPPGKSKTIAKVTKTVVGNAAQALNSMTRHKGDSPPFWIGGNDAWPAGEVLACGNGLVHLPSYIAGKSDYMRPLTPRFFSTLNLGYDFEPHGREPKEWLKFLRSVWPNDPESIALVQEYGGYLLTLDTRFQKALMVKGPPRSGKGTICRVWEAMLGRDNVAATSLNALADNHGLDSLVGKSFAMMGDERIGRRTDQTAAVRNLLGIIGEDLVDINPKNQPRYSCRLTARFAICTNDLLDLPDTAGALAARLLVLRMTRSFVGREDTGLLGKLQQELPGILRWHIEGWARLRERGVFTQPTSGAELLDEFREANGPIGAFVKARCILGAGLWASRLDLYAAYREWCAATGRTPVGEADFFRELGSAAPGIRESRPAARQGRTERPYGYAGIGLAAGEPEPVRIVLPADWLATYPVDPAIYALLVRCLIDGLGQPLPPDLLAMAG